MISRALGSCRIKTPTLKPFSSQATSINELTQTQRGSSEAYSDSRKYARPSTIPWSNRLHNSVSLIGTVKYPVKQYAAHGASSSRFGVYTLLLVNNASSPPFWITVAMWDELAHSAVLHLKPQHYVYVSGQLGSYTKVSQGVQTTRFKVTAKEFNYVKVDEQGKSDVNSQKETGKYIGKCSLQNQSNRLHLWQIFFASPGEWYDHRKSKKNPRQPDFRHKSTNEALWLNEYDPPWVHKQIELLDSKLLRRGNDSTSSFTTSEWLFDDHLAEPSTNDWKIFK